MFYSAVNVGSSYLRDHTLSSIPGVGLQFTQSTARYNRSGYNYVTVFTLTQ